MTLALLRCCLSMVPPSVAWIFGDTRFGDEDSKREADYVLCRRYGLSRQAR